MYALNVKFNLLVARRTIAWHALLLSGVFPFVQQLFYKLWSLQIAFVHFEKQSLDFGELVHLIGFQIRVRSTWLLRIRVTNRTCRRLEISKK